MLKRENKVAFQTTLDGADVQVCTNSVMTYVFSHIVPYHFLMNKL